MRICIVYDCLYPWTVGGAERWYRNLAEAMARDGHEVTYLTRRQWPRHERPDLPGVRVLAVSREEPLYGPDGNRRIGEALRFGWGVLRHLLGHRRDYDVVHTCAFPYFSLLAARVALAGTGVRLGVDWFEVWTLGYWRSYLGRVPGRVGHLVQRACALSSGLSFVFSELHARRLREEGLRRQPVRLTGLYAGELAPGSPAPVAEPPVVLFAGRFIAEKNAPAVPAALAWVRSRGRDVRGMILGDGPQAHDVRRAVRAEGLEDVVSVPGFVAAEEVQAAMAGASCLLLPSSREGYGLVVIEAASAGTPSVVVAGEDNAAVERITEGENGFVAADASPEALGTAILACLDGGPDLRASTRAWFAREAPRLSLDASIAQVMEAYATTRS